MKLRLKVATVLGAIASVITLGVSNHVTPAAQIAIPVRPPLSALGDQLFHDTTLSEPAGMACVTCHDPSTGFSYPESDVNDQMGPVPGIIQGRFGNRKPPSAAYAPYLLSGTPTYDPNVQAFTGGLFWDGRAPDAVVQAKAPFLNPNEMNNLVHGLGSPTLVVLKIRYGPSGPLFKAVFGNLVFSLPPEQIYPLVASAIAAYEKSAAVSPFSSKYDAYLAGKATLTDQEMLGLRLATGTWTGRPGGLSFPVSAHCMDCHGISRDLSKAPDLWTNSCYANLGVPKNQNNPYYTMTNQSNPGFNPLGAQFIDYGLGDYLYPLLGKPVADLAENDPLQIDGTFKAPSLRNVDKRPYPGFVKAYMHNGVFKSLKQVVHFYNTRNLTTMAGEVIDFTQPDPYANLVGTPLWPTPEWASPVSLINPTGKINGPNIGGMGSEQVGNLRLSPSAEDAIVAFLQTLSDGYFKPGPTKAP